MPDNRSRRWSLVVWTENVPEDLPPFASYIVGQSEKCPSTDKIHQQCYVESIQRHTQSALIKKLTKHFGDIKFHVEPCIATQQKNIAYCTKPESRVSTDLMFEYGDKMCQGERNDLVELTANVMEGASDEAILELNPTWLRYDRFINKIRSTKLSKFAKVLRDVNIILVHGPPGVGKSRYVWERIERLGQDFYQPPPPKNGNYWFDGYTGEDTLWLEDIQFYKIDRSLILRILDRYPLKIETKGGVSHAAWKTVYITTNDSPELIDEAVRRRFTEVICFDEPEQGGLGDPPQSP
jgi:hypothetical protein